MEELKAIVSKNQETQNYIKALYEVLTPANQRELYQAKAGRYGGTFAHPKLAVFFARWLDVRFAVWCDSIIDDNSNSPPL